MKRILAIDDDLQLLEMLGKALIARGFAVAACPSTNGVIEKTREFKPDYILLDVMFPGGTGYQLARSLRSDSGLYKVPILFVSAVVDGPEIAHALKQGGDGYLTKPFTMEQLLARLRTLDVLAEKLSNLDARTGLLQLEAIGREIDYRIFRQEHFALCYFTIKNVEAFEASRGTQDTERLIAWTASLLKEQARETGLHETQLGHLGGGHFLALLPIDDQRKYCRAVHKHFDEGVKQFYKQFEVDQGYVVGSRAEGVYEGARLMHLHIVLFRSDEHEFDCYHAVLKAFQKALEAPEDDKVQAVFRFYQKYKW
ncbi:MAG: response regulator [Candidatus Hydrogenedentes bacterium]|nr:response regulator [Candidatus Hydrogenedentota bacterium]